MRGFFCAHMFMCVAVHMYVPVNMHVCVHMETGGQWAVSSSTALSTSFSGESCFWTPACLSLLGCLSLLTPVTSSTEVSGVHSHAQVYVNAGKPGSGPHARIVRTPSRSPQPPGWSIFESDLAEYNASGGVVPYLHFFLIDKEYSSEGLCYIFSLTNVYIASKVWGLQTILCRTFMGYPFVSLCIFSFSWTYTPEFIYI